MKMMRKVVIDTNVLVSALLSSNEDSTTVRILVMFFAGLVSPILTNDKDRPFLDAMLSEDDAILVTGNLKHFPQHEQIMTARSFIAMHGEL